jgi:hypothetical protein
MAGIGLTLLLGWALRLHDYTLAPGFLDNADELQFAWAGLTLITSGDSYSWSYFPAYPHVTALPAYGTSFPMVHHWLDHPPGFSLVVGGLAWLFGDRQLLDVTAGQIRLLPIATGSLSIVLAYVLGSRVLGAAPALIGALLLATAPGAVLLSRQVEPECLLAPMLLGVLIVCQRLLDGGPHRALVLLLLALALTAPLLKVPGVALGGIAAAILLVAGRWRLAIAVLGAAAVGLLAYVAYGAWVDWPLFVKIFQLQERNRTGVLPAFDFIADAAGVNRRLRDGWWLLGWIGVGLWLVRGRRSPRELLLAWPLAAYALTIAVMAGEIQTAQYGWYRVILYPEIHLAAGYLVWQAVSRPTLGRLGLVLALGGATAAEFSLGRPWVPHPVLLGALLVAVLLPVLLAAWRPEPGWRRLAQVVAGLALAAIVGLNSVESFFLSDIFSRL